MNKLNRRLPYWLAGLALLLVVFVLWASPSLAATTQPQVPQLQSVLDPVDLRTPIQSKDLGSPLQLIVFMAFLTILPFVFIMTTSFIRTIIVLSFLRTAIGTQQVPPNQVIVGLAIFLFVFLGAIASVQTDPKAALILSRIWIAGVIPFFVGLGILANAFFVSRRFSEHRQNLLRSVFAPPAALPAALSVEPVRTTGELPALEAPPSVTEHTTRHLPDHEREGWRALFGHYVFGARGGDLAHIAEGQRHLFGDVDAAADAALREDLVERLQRGSASRHHK